MGRARLTIVPLNLKADCCGLWEQVNNNNLTGCLPSAWASGLTNITTIDLANNQLSGPIPESWQASGAFPTLQTM